jgi:hypothetical protein
MRKFVGRVTKVIGKRTYRASRYPWSPQTTLTTLVCPAYPCPPWPSLPARLPGEGRRGGHTNDHAWLAGWEGGKERGGRREEGEEEFTRHEVSFLC